MLNRITTMKIRAPMATAFAARNHPSRRGNLRWIRLGPSNSTTTASPSASPKYCNPDGLNAKVMSSSAVEE